MSDTTTKQTALHGLHTSLGAKMVPFAGYDMPVQYPMGVLKEHQHCRAAAGLFDVSHMGQVILHGDDAAAALETIVPGDILGLEPGQMRYTQFTNEKGGILDDLMVTRGEGHVMVVVNAGCKDADIAHMREHIGDRCEIEYFEDKPLVALQGPKAAEVLARFDPDCATMAFMSGRAATIEGAECFVTRSGYTGEDGYEISIPADVAEGIVKKLLDAEEVEPIGLGARDSLRLEAGLCLYGHDIDETTTPIEAALLWSIGKRRREDGGFPGAEIVQKQIADGVSRKRVGILPDGRAPAREGTEIQDADGNTIGEITSGGFGPTFGGPVAMGYVAIEHAKAETPVTLIVRGKPLAAKVAKTPFVPQNYYRG